VIAFPPTRKLPDVGCLRERGLQISSRRGKVDVLNIVTMEGTYLCELMIYVVSLLPRCLVSFVSDEQGKRPRRAPADPKMIPSEAN
jgi:hypothetical protein